MGVDISKFNTRKLICSRLHDILGIQKKPIADKEARKKIWKCSDYRTNRGKKCPNCCSHHKDTCMWVRGKGCKTKNI